MSKSLAITVYFLVAGLVVGTAQVPDGVRYKAAPDALNQQATAMLERALSTDGTPGDEFFGTAVVVGPMLWKDLRPSSPKLLLDAKPVMMFVNTPEPAQAEAKALLRADERNAFWTVFRGAFPKLAGAKVRKATPAEISYYWATIPFEIEEPLLVVDTGSEQFVINMPPRDGKTPVFWIDRFGDLRSLAK